MPMRTGTPMPELDGATEWINGEAPRRDELIGNPTLVCFWAVSCHLCHENMPAVAAWREQYGPQGLNVIFIHMPRQPQDTDVEKVRKAVAELGIGGAVGIDNQHALTDAFQNSYVPAYFLFDREGNLRSRTAGDAGLAMMEAALRRQFA